MSESLSLLINSTEAAHLTGLSRSKFYSELSAGRIGPAPVKFGKSSRFSREEFERWVRAGCPTREHWRAQQGGCR